MPAASAANSLDGMLFYTGLLFSALNFVVGLLYPAWSCLASLSNADPTDDTQWLTYWLSYAMLLVVEYALHWLLVWIPMYNGVRLVLLLWMAVPYLRGAEYLYENVYRLHFLKFKGWLGQAPALEFVKPPPPQPQGGGQDEHKAQDPFVASLRRRVAMAK